MALYQKALTHSSMDTRDGENYERLEFLGDVIVKLIVTEELMELYPDSDEGLLATKRALYVQDKLLAKISKDIGLGKLLICGANEEKNNIQEEISVLSDILESIIGAVYTDLGLEEAKKFGVLLFHELIIDESKVVDFMDNKTILQEITQSLQLGIPEYSIINEEGPDHEKVFTAKVSIMIEDAKVYQTSTDKTKKNAEQKAAKLLIEELTSE